MNPANLAEFWTNHEKKARISCEPRYNEKRTVSHPTSTMITKKITIQNKLGIHARPAAQFVRVASRFQADVSVEKDDEAVDGKSIMGLMMLAVGWGAEIAVTADGPDESEAMAALEELINNKFGED